MVSRTFRYLRSSENAILPVLNEYRLSDLIKLVVRNRPRRHLSRLDDESMFVVTRVRRYALPGTKLTKEDAYVDLSVKAVPVDGRSASSRLQCCSAYILSNFAFTHQLY